MEKARVQKLEKWYLPPVTFEERFFVWLLILPFSLWIAAFGLEDFLSFDSCQRGFFVEISYWYATNCKPKNLGSLIGNIWLIFCATYILIPLIGKVPRASRLISMALVLHANYFGFHYYYRFFRHGIVSNEVGHTINLIILTVFLYLILYVQRSATHAHV